MDFSNIFNGLMNNSNQNNNQNNNQNTNQSSFDNPAKSYYPSEAFEQDNNAGFQHQATQNNNPMANIGAILPMLAGMGGGQNSGLTSMLSLLNKNNTNENNPSSVLSSMFSGNKKTTPTPKSDEEVVIDSEIEKFTKVEDYFKRNK